MKVMRGTVDHHLLTNQPTQPRRDRRCAPIGHAGVANQRHIGLELRSVGLEERHQIGPAAFFLPLDQDRDLQRQIALDDFPGAAGFDEGEKLSLIVRCTARHDDLAAIGLRLNRGVEGIALPQIERVRGLNVIMAIK